MSSFPEAEAGSEGAHALQGLHSALTYFGEAISGQPVHVHWDDEPRRGWPWELSLPVPRVVWLYPPQLESSGGALNARPPHWLQRVQVLHSAALVEFGTYGDEPSALELDACQQHEAIKACRAPRLAAAIVVMLEHLRVGAATDYHYPGASNDRRDALALSRTHWTEKRRERSLGGTLVDALHLCCLGASATELLTSCPTLAASEVNWLMAATNPLRERQATREHSALAAVQLADRWSLPLAVDLPDPSSTLPDPAASAGQETDGIGQPGNPEREEDADTEPQSGQLAIGSLPDGLSAEQLEEALGGPGSTLSGWSPLETDRDRTFYYDEWDASAQRYRTAWCRLREHHVAGRDSVAGRNSVAGDDTDFITAVRREYAVLRRQIQSQFSRLRPDDLVRLPRQLDGDELDLDAAIEAIIDRRSGAPFDDRVTVRRDRAQRDVATAFLVDLSASTSSPTVEPEPYVPGEDEDEYDFLLDPTAEAARHAAPARRVIDVAKESVALMCDALADLGDRHAVYGFSGQTRLDVEFHVSKEFDEPTSSTTWSAIAALQPIKYTRMGPAIRHATRKLAATDARTNLLFVISDGHPQDVDYGPDRNDKSYGVADTARAVQEAFQAGVDAFCLTIDPAGTDYLGDMFPDERYLVIEDVESLPSELAKLYSSVAYRG